MKVVLNEHLLADAYLSELAASFPAVTIRPAPSIAEQLREIGDAEMLCGPLTPELFQAAKALRWVHYPGTGVDWVASVPEFVKSDIVLTNARGPHAEPMADHLFAMLLTLTHRMRELADDQHARRWEVAKYYDRMPTCTGGRWGFTRSAVSGGRSRAARRDLACASSASTSDRTCARRVSTRSGRPSGLTSYCKRPTFSSSPRR
jgi:phosphoglycerate dehydrogenase-like enzyme